MRERDRLANKNQGRLANVFGDRFDTYFYARCSAASRLIFRPDSDLVAGRHLRACVGVRVACPHRVSTANAGSQGLQVRLEAGLPAQALAAPRSEGCCSGELREGQHI